MPEVLVVRHAIAEPRDEATAAGRDDSQRALTKRGAKRMRAAARGLARAVPSLTRIATSPLVRARQTADLLTEVYGVSIETLPALAADDALLPPTKKHKRSLKRLQRLFAGVPGFVEEVRSLGRELVVGEDSTPEAQVNG